MKKTLFLSAILGAALCSSAFGETYTSISANQTITTAAGDTIGNISSMGNNSAFVIGGDTTSTGNIKVNGTNASITINEGAQLSFTSTGNYALQLDNTSSLTLSGGVFDITKAAKGLAVNAGATLTLNEGVTLKSKQSFYSTGTAKNGTLVMQNNTKAQFTGEATFGALVIDGAASFSASTANIGALTIHDAGTLTVGAGTTMNVAFSSAYLKNESTVTGNGFSTGVYEREFGSSLIIDDGATLKVNGSAATFENGVLKTGTVATKKYYLNDAAQTINFSGAEYLEVGNTTVQLTNGISTLNDLVVNGGTVTLAFTESFHGDLHLMNNASATVTTNDKLDYGAAGLGKSITVEAGSTLDMGSKRFSMGYYTVNMQGGVITGAGEGDAGALDFHRGDATHDAIVASGEVTSTISAAVRLRTNVKVNVADEASLVMSGKINQEGNTAHGLTKKGAGTLTLSYAENTFSNGVTIEEGTVIAAHKASLGTGTVSVADGAVLSINESISALTAAGSGKVNVNSNAMTFTGAGSTAFSGTLNVVAEASTDHGKSVNLNNFAGTVELTGRFGAASCNFGNATKIVLHGDRDNGDTTLASNNTTGFWSNSAQTFSQLIEVKGEHWVDIFASKAYTFNGAVSGDMLRTLNGEAVTFNSTVTLDKFTDLNNAVAFNGNTSIGTLDIASGKTVTFAADTVNTLTTLSGAGNVVNNGTIDMLADAPEVAIVRTENGYDGTHHVATIGGTGTLSGTGSWTLNGTAATLDGHTLSTAAVLDETSYYVDKADATYNSSLAAKYVIAEGKKLTATGTVTNIQVKENNGTLVLDNVTGWFINGQHNFGDVEIVGTLELNNGYSKYSGGATNIATINNLSGTGTIKTTTTGITGERTVIAGDVDSTISFSNTRDSGEPTFAFTKDVEKVTLNSISNTGAGSLSFEANGLVVNSLTLSAGTVGVYGIDAAHTEENETSLTTTTLTVSGNSHLNADLVIATGGTMDFSTGHVLTMGSSVTIGDRVEVYITGSAEDIRAGRQEITIMDSVEDAITLNNAIIFVNGVQQSDLYLTLTDDHRIVVAPEPATATLSLLALAALCARRKRH